jgi:RHS repeat-associated protein
LTAATVNGMTTEFTYDSRNRVVQRTSGNGTLNLSYSGWNLIEERNGGRALEQVYVHGAGTDEILVKITAAGPAYYHHDGLGSTIALTGENGALLESYRYDAFGAATVYDSSGSALPASPRENRFLFTGREWLSQVDLYDYRNRVYSAQIGRFLQTDPIRFAAGDVNIYRYVSNNPIKFIDPMGLCQSYGDLNLTLITPLGIGITGGLFFNATGVNPYLGLAIGSPGPSASFTAASGAISAGQTSSQIQASAIFTASSGASGGSNQNGTGPGSTPFTEVGFGSPGISYSTYYTW